MMLNPEVFLNVLQALPRNENEKCELVSKNWADLIGKFDRFIPLRKLYSIEFTQKCWRIHENEGDQEFKDFNRWRENMDVLIKICNRSIFEKFSDSDTFFDSDGNIKLGYRRLSHLVKHMG